MCYLTDTIFDVRLSEVLDACIEARITDGVVDGSVLVSRSGIRLGIIFARMGSALIPIWDVCLDTSRSGLGTSVPSPYYTKSV